jgi:hypothetical protein
MSMSGNGRTKGFKQTVIQPTQRVKSPALAQLDAYRVN